MVVQARGVWAQQGTEGEEGGHRRHQCEKTDWRGLHARLDARTPSPPPTNDAWGGLHELWVHMGAGEGQGKGPEWGDCWVVCKEVQKQRVKHALCTAAEAGAMQDACEST